MYSCIRVKNGRQNESLSLQMAVKFHVLTLLDGLGAEFAMVHPMTKPVSSPPVIIVYMGKQFGHLDYHVGMIGGKWGFHQMGLTPLREG